MSHHDPDLDEAVGFQARLSACTATGISTMVSPHHPITCEGALRFGEDGTFSCDHAAAPPGDERTQFCLDLSLALLLMEAAQEL